MKGAKNPIFLILDNHPIHKTKLVQEFVEKQKGKLSLFFLPPYSPELNPDELVWNHVKNHRLSRHLVKGVKDLKSLVCSSLFSLQKMHKKVQSFFQTPTTAYTSA
jgi:transposase